MTGLMTPEKKIDLSLDQQALFKKAMSSLGMVWNSMNDAINGDTLSKDFAATLITAFENNVRDLAGLLDISTEKMEQEQSVSEMRRQINKARIKEIEHLKQQIGKGISPTAGKEVVAAYAKSVGLWWQSTGLGSPYLHDSTIALNGTLCIKFSVDLDELTSVMSETPVSDKQSHVERLNKIADIYDVELCGRRTISMLDTESNRDKLYVLIQTRFPNSYITQFENHMASPKNKVMILRRIHVSISEYV